MIAVGNRVLLCRGDNAFLNHTKLGRFIASSFIGSVFSGPSVHRPNDDVLLALALLADGVKKFTFSPRWDRCVTVGDLSAKEECPKGW